MDKKDVKNSKQPKALMVAGLAGGSGKSIVSVGLTAAFTAQGYAVRPFKKGPDYIDAGWMKMAARKNCYNLDQYLMDDGALRASFFRHSQGSDLVIVEGNRGLYDGVNAEGGFSTAELAVTLDVPILLVVDCTKTTRTIAALILGCLHFDKRVNIIGVILNQVATPRQKKVITEAVEKYTGVPVLGTIPRLKQDIFPMRHLGMVPHQEYQGREEALRFLSELLLKNSDLEKIVSLMKLVNVMDQPFVEKSHISKRAKIGVLQDAAFQFYYSENLEALEAAGAQLVSINAMTAQSLPEIDGLYIGGGFPETSARELAANTSFRESVKEFAEQGFPIYAECGGLIYLGESIILDDVEYRLTGVFPVRFGMSKKPQAHGYSIFRVEKDNPFYDVGTVVKGHEFRYSTVIDFGGDLQSLVVKMKRGTGFWEGYDGLCCKNTLAMYTHVHAEGTPEWAPAIVRCCLKAKKGKR